MKNKWEQITVACCRAILIGGIMKCQAVIKINKGQKTEAFSDKDSLFLRQSDKRSVKCNGHYKF